MNSSDDAEVPGLKSRFLGAFVYLCFLGLPEALVPLWVIYRRDKVFLAHLRGAFLTFLAASFGFVILGLLVFGVLDGSTLGVLLLILAIGVYIGLYLVLAIRAATGWVPFQDRMPVSQ